MGSQRVVGTQHSMHSMLRLGGSIFVVVLKPTLCQIPRTLAGWLKGGSGQLRCDCEIKS